MWAVWVYVELRLRRGRTLLRHLQAGRSNYNNNNDNKNLFILIKQVCAAQWKPKNVFRDQNAPKSVQIVKIYDLIYAD